MTTFCGCPPTTDHPPAHPPFPSIHLHYGVETQGVFVHQTRAQDEVVKPHRLLRQVGIKRQVNYSKVISNTGSNTLGIANEIM